MADETGGKTTFWDFASDHPVLVIIVVLALISGVTDIASAITGHWEHDKDGFWPSACTGQKQ